jgi:hypothetical protein
MIRKIAGAAMLMMAVAGSAPAAIMVYETPAGATPAGQPVSARATITTGVNSISVLLENLLVNPTGVAQNLSGFAFSLSGGQTLATLTSSSGMERVVNSDRSFTDNGLVSTGWAIEAITGGIKLNVLGSGTGPAHTIIGDPAASGLYASSNGSIRGNGPHNPFLAGDVSFDLSVPGVTADTLLTGTSFFFNTSNGQFATGELKSSNVMIPEPGAAGALAVAGAAAVLRRRT